MDEEKPEFPVGYGKPPRETQFKPGESGNPNGRPKKKAGTFSDSIGRELDTLITVNEGGKQRRITKLQAIAKQQTNKAATGDIKATTVVMRAIEPRESDQRDTLSPVLQAMRAIHAKHEMANQKNAPTVATSDLSENSMNDRDNAHNDPA